ncbi:MAG: thiolase family protein [Candidatus Korarchaeum sp.]|jgi:acetyl-CoA C-acetyltransferase|nr:thiolase family protein [Candidatus Korarchaeum sp.]
MLSDVFIVSFARTPIGKFGGALSKMTAPQLGAVAIEAAVRRSGLEPSDVDEVIMGNVLQAMVGQNPARQAAIIAGIPKEVPGFTVNKVCASGMKAITLAAQSIALGENRVVVAGGMESMSNAPYALPPQWRWGVKFSFTGEKLIDLMVYDGLTDPHTGLLMGEEAEETARKWGISREECDEFAVSSHMKAEEATERGYFAREIERVRDVPLERDEGIRPDTSIEKIAKLRPAFRPDGVITAANASQLSDGAAALVLAHGEVVEERGLEPIARIIGFSSASLEPRDFIEAPIISTKKLLSRIGMGIDDFDIIEHNEAFALATLVVAKGLGIPLERLNPFGGAVALGHPLGASGARIVVTLLNALRVRGKRRGLATICHGGGGAQSIAIELVR